MRIVSTFSRYVLVAGIVIGISGISTRLIAGPSSAVLDAKRKAAIQLMRDGKNSDAYTLLNEVLVSGSANYSDHLLMAHACEKLSQAVEATEHYHAVLKLVPDVPVSADERAARSEAEKKIKLNDPLSGKIDAAVDEFNRKLDGLERDALAAKNMTAMERVFRLRGLLWRADRSKGKAFLEVFADMHHGVWQPTGFEIKEKMTYRVRAAGRWEIQGNAGVDSHIKCTAAGTDERKAADYPYRIGSLIGQVNGRIIQLGEDCVFTAPATGELLLFESDLTAETRANNSGSLQVLITAQ